MNDNLKNYATKPDPEVWEGIQRTMRRRAVRRQAWTGAAGAVLVVLAVVGVVFWPDGKNDVTTQSALPDVAQVMTQGEEPMAVEQQLANEEEMRASMPKPVSAETAMNNRPIETQSAVSTSLPKSETSVAATLPLVASQPVSAPAVSKPAIVESRVPAPAAVSDPQPQPATVVDVDESAQVSPKASVGNINEDTILWLPNIFVPGSDDAEINIFRARLNRPGEELTNYRMTIFSRAGSQVFMSSDINMGWDGTYRGRPMPQAAYVYVIYYTDKDGFRHQCKGTITLVR